MQRSCLGKGFSQFSVASAVLEKSINGNHLYWINAREANDREVTWSQPPWIDVKR